MCHARQYAQSIRLRTTVDLEKASAVIGTSAGAFVGAAVACAYDLETLAEAQSQPGPDEIAVAASQETIVAWFGVFVSSREQRRGAKLEELRAQGQGGLTIGSDIPLAGRAIGQPTLYVK
jgi:hypothetical protein